MRPRTRLKRSDTQWRDRDWNGLSLRIETKTTKNIETKTKVVETIKDETSKFGSRLISENLSRPRLNKTGKFYRYWDRDSSRLGNLIDVKTETYRDWEILRLSRLRLIKTGQKMSRLYRESRWSLLGPSQSHLVKLFFPTVTFQIAVLLSSGIKEF